MVTRTLYTSGSSGNLMIVDSSVTGAALETLCADPTVDLNKIRFHSALNYLDIQDEISGTVTFPAYARNVNTIDGGSCNTYSIAIATPKVQSETLGTSSVSNPLSLLLEYNSEVSPDSVVVASGTAWNRQIYASNSGSSIQLTSIGMASTTNMPATTITVKVYVLG
jgi:hypothetical protein